jgi:hypothetical protein
MLCEYVVLKVFDVKIPHSAKYFGNFLKNKNIGPQAEWSSGIVCACHQGDWSYGS